MRKVIAVSGGFDPIHIGHTRHFQEAKELGDVLVVLLNSDRFLKKKKGYVFMPFDERREIIEAIGCVDMVVPVIDTDQSVRETLAVIRPDVFAKGGDRTSENIPECGVCEMLGIDVVYGIGGEKVQSSSDLIRKVCEEHYNVVF